LKTIFILAAVSIWMAVAVRGYRSAARSLRWIDSARCALCGVELMGNQNAVVHGRPVCVDCAGPYRRQLRLIRNTILAIMTVIASVLVLLGIEQLRTGQPDGPIMIGLAALFGSGVLTHFVFERVRARRFKNHPSSR
jgi:hypothetical protein